MKQDDDNNADRRENAAALRYRIKDLPQHERPRERLRDLGPAALSNSELLAILLRTGTARFTAIELASNLLSRFGSLNNLAQMSVAELGREHGMGVAKSAQVLAALELGRRTASWRDGARPCITCPEDAANLLRAEMQALKKEVMKILLLNSKNEVVKVMQISEGSLNSTVLHPRETFREAVREAAAAVVLAHNHPSGDPEPSGDDIAVTREFRKVGAMLGIEVLDHIILGNNGRFASMRERGVFD